MTTNDFYFWEKSLRRNIAMTVRSTEGHFSTCRKSKMQKHVFLWFRCVPRRQAPSFQSRVSFQLPPAFNARMACLDKRLIPAFGTIRVISSDGFRILQNPFFQGIPQLSGELAGSLSVARDSEFFPHKWGKKISPVNTKKDTLPSNFAWWCVHFSF